MALERTSPIFRKNLMALRKEHGYTCAQVGQAIGIGESTVWKYENGDAFPRPATIDRLADLYKVSIADLFCPDGAERKAVELNTTRQNVLELFKNMLLDGRVPNEFWQSLKKAAG